MSRINIFRKFYSLSLSPAIAAAGIVLLFLAGPGLSAGENAESIVRTRALGEGGSVDAFLTDVVPEWPGWSRRWWTDKELWGNQGYIIGGPRGRLREEDLMAVGLSEEIDALTEFPPAPEPPLEKVDLDTAAQKPDTHRVVKGECLWYIAGYDHIYGNPLQWPIIYKANTDRIKHPDLIYPGQVFVIPRD